MNGVKEKKSCEPIYHFGHRIGSSAVFHVGGSTLLLFASEFVCVATWDKDFWAP